MVVVVVVRKKMIITMRRWLTAKLMPSETRYLVAFLLCVANTICYADRTNIGIAAPLFVPDEEDRGVVLSAFFYGYMLTQIPAGYLASRFGVKTVLAFGVVVWTVFDASTVLASRSLPLLILVRACMGCGEGVVMPCLHRFAVNWFPASERSTLVAVIGGGVDLGTILALFLSPMILKATGRWSDIFLAFAFFSAVWLVFYLRCVTSKPEDHPRISREEKELIIATARGGGSEGGSAANDHHHRKIPWRTLLTNRHLWVIYVTHFSFNYSWYVLLGWLPTYVRDHLDLDLKENKLVAATPYLCGYLGLLIGGRVSDLLIARGHRTLHVRRVMNSIGSFGPAACLHLLRYANEPATAVLLLSGSLFTGRCSHSGYWINMIDVGPDHADRTMGMSNTIATLPGIFGNLITGYVLKHTGSWNIVFDIAATVSVFGGIVFAFFSTDANVFARTPSDVELQAILD